MKNLHLNFVTVNTSNKKILVTIFFCFFIDQISAPIKFSWNRSGGSLFLQISNFE